MSYAHSTGQTYSSLTNNTSQGSQYAVDNNKNIQQNKISYQKNQGVSSRLSYGRQSLESKNNNKMINTPYTINDSQSPKNPNTKLTEMSSDLAKLKQQLSKIMSQANKFQKRNTGINQTFAQRSQNQQVFQTNLKYKSKDSNQLYPAFNNKKLDDPSNTIKNDAFNIRQIQKQKAISKAINLPNFSDSLETKINTRPLGMNYKNSQQNTQNIKGNSQYIQNGNSNYQNLNKKQILNKSQSITKLSSQTNINEMNFKPSLKINEQTYVNSSSQMKNMKVKDQFSNLNLTTQFKPKQFDKLNFAFNEESNVNKSSFVPSSPSSHTQSFSYSKIPNHTYVVNRLMNEQFNKKIEQRDEIQQQKRKKAQQQLQFQQKIIELEHQKRKLKHQLSNAILQKESLQLAFKTQKSQKQLFNRKYKQLEEIIRTYRTQLQDSKTKCRLLQKKLQNQISRPKTITHQNPSFDDILKQQISQINKYKEKLELKDEQVMRLKDLSTNHRRQIESLNNQIKIQQLKAAFQLNQIDQKKSILLQDKQNQIKTCKNLVITLQSKLSFAIKQNQSKDAFMVQHLTGKTKIGQQKQYIQNFFKRYTVQFPTNKFGQKIQEEQLQIQKLKKTILQMAGGI